MERRAVYGILIGLAVIVAIVCFNITNSTTHAVSSNSKSNAPMVVVPSAPSFGGGASESAYSNLVGIIAGNQMVKDLPSGATILLRFYNFNTGERQWEKSFVLTKGSVAEGTANVDITIIVHSKYLSELTSTNLCEVLSKAKANGDFGFDSSKSTTSLLWQFKSMLKYRTCLGF